jgi:serine O-acetyltransferase
MKSTLTPAKMSTYVGKQLWTFFPDDPVDEEVIKPVVVRALERTEFCLSRIGFPAYFDGEQTLFSHRNTDQYATFLYFLSRAFFAEFAMPALAAKAYALNKMLHGLDAFYEVELPDVFYLQHPVGTVLGRATYGNYFVVYQNVTVGSSLGGDYPVFGEGVAMFGGARVIGKTHISANSWISPGATIMDETFPPASILFDASPTVKRKRTQRDVKSHFFSRAEVI